jgi:type II secretory pathway component PulF
MAVFQYVAMSHDGRRLSGEIEALSRADAFRKLDGQRLQPITLESRGLNGAVHKAAESGTPETAPVRGIRLSRSQIILFTEEMSDLLDAGLQLEPALRVMENRKELSSLKQVASTLRQQVREGTSLSRALRQVSPNFGDLYCNLVTAGEISGSLPQLLKRQAIFLVTLDDLQKKVVSALIYPAMISVLGLGLVFLFLTYLVPQLTSLFEKTGKQLPLVTRLLIGTSSFFSHYWWLILGTIAAVIIGFFQYIRSKGGKRWWHEAQLGLPLFGAVLKGRFYTQFSQTMANLVANGIPLLTGLQLMNNATTNLFLRQQMEQIVAIVGEGGSLSRAMQKVGVFPPLFVDMVTVGEQTGDLSKALDKVGLRYDKELNLRIQRLTTLIQPVIIFVMAGMVGLIAYSIVNGIMDAVSGLAPH